jgi:hypothetical protein
MKKIFIKISLVITYLGMIVVNFLANALPINNRSTGEISDLYANLFAPAGITFSIWGLIYLLLGAYVVYQFIKNPEKESLFTKINPLFILTSLANIAWIMAWHYDFIGLSVLIMAVLLFLLIKIADICRLEKFTTLQKVLISAPFSIYFGWITVASIANVTVFLVSIGWNGFGLADFIWTILILFVGALIGILRSLKDKNIFYVLVLIWAYLGILFKHLSVSGFDGQYPSIIVSVIVCLFAFAFFGIRILYKK